MKVIGLTILFLVSISTVYANDNSLKVSDEGWLKDTHATCQEKYDFDPEIAANCYKNKKNEKIYALRKIILKEKGFVNISNEIDKICLKYVPVWEKALRCFDKEFLKYQ